MRRLRLCVAIPFFMALALGACSNVYYVDFSYAIKQVTRDGTPLAVDSARTLEYHDSAFAFHWSPVWTWEGMCGLCLDLENRMDRPATVLWTEAQFADLDGMAQPFIVAGSGGAPVADTVPVVTRVPPRGRLHELLIPAHALKPGQRIKPAPDPDVCTWAPYTDIKPLIPRLERSWPLSPAKLHARAAPWLDRRFGVTVPISVDGVVRLYHFDLTVSGYSIIHYTDL